MENEKFQQIVLEHLNELTSGQKKMDSRMGNLEQDVSGLKQDVSKMDSRLGNLEQDVSGLKKDVSVMKDDVSDLKQRQLKLETRIETELIDKTRILFDGWQLHEEKIDRVEGKLDQVIDKLDDLSTDTRYLVGRVAKLEKLAK